MVFSKQLNAVLALLAILGSITQVQAGLCEPKKLEYIMYKDKDCTNRMTQEGEGKLRCKYYKNFNSACYDQKIRTKKHDSESFTCDETGLNIKFYNKNGKCEGDPDRDYTFKWEECNAVKGQRSIFVKLQKPD